MNFYVQTEQQQIDFAQKKWFVFNKREGDFTVTDLIGTFNNRKEARKNGRYIFSLNQLNICVEAHSITAEASAVTDTTVKSEPFLPAATVGRRKSAADVSVSDTVWAFCEEQIELNPEVTNSELLPSLVEAGLHRATVQQELVYWRKADKLFHARLAKDAKNE